MYTFPSVFEDFEPRFLSEAGSLQFLAKCHFDFNKWVYDGIPYMPCSLRDLKLKKLNEVKEPRPDIIPTKPYDIAMVEKLITDVRKWLHGEDANNEDINGGSIYSGSEGDDPDNEFFSMKFTEEYLRLDPVNSYQRALQYQTLRNNDHFNVEDPPGFYVERVEDNYGKVALKLIRASSVDIAAKELEEQEKRIDAINNAASFCQILELMRDSRKPAVGHNLSFDLAYILNSFCKPNPPTWMEFKDRVKKWFPSGVYDTKYITGLYEDAFRDTSLGALFKATTLLSNPPIEDGEICYTPEERETVDEIISVFGVTTFDEVWPLNEIEHAEGFDRYIEAAADDDDEVTSPGLSHAHEAGYDAYMTGTVFAQLIHLLCVKSREEEGEISREIDLPLYSLEIVERYCWRMNISRSDMGYAVLVGPDNVLPRKNILYLTKIDPGSFRHGGDLIKKLQPVKELLAGAYVRVNILGQQDTALLEIPVQFAEDEEMLRNVAMAVEQAVPGCCVKSFDEYRTVKAMIKAGMDIDEEENNGNGVVPAKRPRTEKRQQEEVLIQAAAAEESSRCSIM
jgi:poly(A)-specific ribonuclease